jgi:anti-sigma factor RsiW
MNCPRSEVALYTGGDLPPRRAARVEAHLAACAECRSLLDELRTGQAALSELRGEPLEDAMLAHVRRRVLARIAAGEQTRSGLPGYWRFALAAAVVLLVMLAWPRHAQKQTPAVTPPEMAHVAPAPPVPAPVIPVRHAIVRRRHRAPLRRLLPPDKSQPLLVQFATDDPNVVIYWLVEKTPQGG